MLAPGSLPRAPLEGSLGGEVKLLGVFLQTAVSAAHSATPRHLLPIHGSAPHAFHPAGLLSALLLLLPGHYTDTHTPHEDSPGNTTP